MKLFKNIKKWLEDQEHLFYLFLFILIVPNIVLCLRSAVVYSKGLQCPVTFWMLLPANDTIEKLR